MQQYFLIKKRREKCLQDIRKKYRIKKRMIDLANNRTSFVKITRPTLKSLGYSRSYSMCPSLKRIVKSITIYTTAKVSTSQTLKEKAIIHFRDSASLTDIVSPFYELSCSIVRLITLTKLSL